MSFRLLSSYIFLSLTLEEEWQNILSFKTIYMSKKIYFILYYIFMCYILKHFLKLSLFVENRRRHQDVKLEEPWQSLKERINTTILNTFEIWSSVIYGFLLFKDFSCLRISLIKVIHLGEVRFGYDYVDECAFRNQFFTGPCRAIVHDTIVRRQISATNRSVSSYDLRYIEVCVNDSCGLIPRGFACLTFVIFDDTFNSSCFIIFQWLYYTFCYHTTPEAKRSNISHTYIESVISRSFLYYGLKITVQIKQN